MNFHRSYKCEFCRLVCAFYTFSTGVGGGGGEREKDVEKPIVTND